MTNYITEKGHWQAVISIVEEGSIEIMNYILKRRCNNPTVFDSQERMARHFGVTTRTIRRWLKPWTDLLILNIRQRWKTSALYEVNPYLLKFSEKYKQIFPALRHFTENALVGIFKKNVLHNYNDINNTNEETSKHGDPSSSSPHFFKKKVETVALEGHSLGKNLLSSVNHIVSHLETIKSCRLSYKTPKSNLKKEEYNERFKEFTNRSNDTSITEMYRHIQFDCLGSDESFDSN